VSVEPNDERWMREALLQADPDIAAVLRPDDIERAFDLNEQFKHVDDIFARVFQCEPVSS